MKETSEAILVRRSKSGDKEAFGELVNKYTLTYSLFSQYSHNTGLSYSQVRVFNNDDTETNMKMFTLFIVSLLEFIHLLVLTMTGLFSKDVEFSSSGEKQWHFINI